ncbi:ATP-binding protein [Comamonas sediminis]|uniref:histidine kinase n=1 Tax=Comamonas sediminis TaxID=1783360 RepID=A0ABV4AYA4_9BURK
MIVINHKLFFAVSAFVSSLVLVPLLFSVRPIGIKKIGIYALGFFIVTFALFLYANFFNDHSVFSLGNYFLTLGVAIQTIGIRKFYNQSSLWLLIVPCTLASEVLGFYFFRIDPHYPSRLKCFTFFLAIFVFIQFYTVVRYGSKSFTNRLLSASLGIEFLVYLIRFSTLFIPHLVPSSPVAFSIIQISYIFVFSAVVPLTAICLMINGAHLLQEKYISEEKKKSQQKTETIGFISHDLRAPLATISGYTAMLLKDANDEQRKSLLSIQRSIDYQLGLVDELQVFSKVELQPLHLKPIPTDLPRLLNEISEYALALCSQQRNSYHYEPFPGLPIAVQMDGNRLQQVLLNLLSNAAKFTHDGAVTLSVTSETASGYCRLYFAVSDTGPGIDLTQGVDIFGAFQQIQATSNSTGLGLFIAQRIVSEMGGTLSVESSPGHGCRFSFNLRVPVSSTGSYRPDARFCTPQPTYPFPAHAAETRPLSPTDIKDHLGNESLEELASYALHGRLTDIENWMERHAKEIAASQFATLLHELLDQFDFAGIHTLALVEQRRSGT